VILLDIFSIAHLLYMKNMEAVSDENADNLELI
jgi:hypothetical protein